MAKQILFGEEARRALQSGIDQLADTVKITNVDLSTEPMYETKFKQMFASMILQKAQSMNPSRDSSADDAHKGGEKKTMKVEQIGVGNLNVFLDNTGADFTIDQIVNLLAAQLMSTEINIDTVINILTNQELKVKIMVGDKELDIKDARKVLIDAVQVVVKSRVDILQEIVAKITSNIKVDVTQDLIDVMLKDVEKIRVALGVDIKVFKDLLNERFASLNIDYRFTGVTKIKAAISEMVDTTEAVRVVLDKLGITDGTISVKKNVTAELIAAIKEVSVQCGVTVTELVQALKQKTKVKLVDEKGIEITEDTLLDIVTEVTVDVQDTATVEVVDKLTAMFAEFKTLKLSTEEIVSRIASLSFVAQVDVDKVVDMLLAREDTRIDIEYVDSEGKTVNLREVLKSKIKAGLVTKAENGVISDITSILKDASFDGKLDGKSLEKIVKELDTVRAKYKVSVEDLVSLIVEYKSEIGVDFTLDGKVVSAAIKSTRVSISTP